MPVSTTLVALALLLSGCGLKGPLYLPPPPAADASAPAADHNNKAGEAAA